MYVVLLSLGLSLIPRLSISPCRSVQQVLEELRAEKLAVDEVCVKRYTRWSLTLQLDKLLKDAEKVCCRMCMTSDLLR